MKNFRAQSSIQEAIALVGALLMAGVIIYAFYTIPTPFQPYFQNTINDIIIGIIILAGVAGIIYLLSKI
jgi:hypothetical protein